MATAPASRRLNLTRDQLSAFLTDQQQIRQFELLFSTVDTLQVIVGTDFEFQADNAAATANEALAQINALAQVVDLNGQAEALSYLAEISKQIQALESAPPFSAPPAVTPASPTTSVQFNNGGAFGGSANFTYVTGTNTFTVGPAGATTTIETLAPTGATIAGTLRLRGKNASAVNGAGGSLQFVGGTGTGTNAGGGFSFTGGSGGATGGGFNLISGAGTALGGSVVLESGNGTGAAGTGGRFFLNAGAGIVDGGAFEMNGGQSTNGIGGGYLLQSGFSINGNGGDFQFIALGGPLGNGQMYFDTDFGGTVIQLTATTGGDPQLGFYGTVPVSQAAAYTKTYATASRTIPNATFTNLVTTAATNVAPYGFTTAAQADAIATKVNALAADVLILKQLIVSLVNDSSTTLGVGLNAT